MKFFPTRKKPEPSFEEKRDTFRRALNDLIDQSGLPEATCAHVLEDRLEDARRAWGGTLGRQWR
jgi:hypothetical protein